MSDPENNRQGKGFKGLQSFGSKSPGSVADIPAIPEQKVLELPAAWAETAGQSAQPQASQSQTAAPSWRGWVIGLGVLGVIFGFFIWVGSQRPSNRSYSSPTATDSSPNTTVYQRPLAVEAEQATPPPAATITLPPVGNGLVLASSQIRYCVYEDRRIKGAERVVDNYIQASVDTFNAMVEDYNSRCGYFRYRSGALMPIEREADQIQAQLEKEGRERMTGVHVGSSGVDAATQAADAADAVAQAAADVAGSAAIDEVEVLSSYVEQNSAERTLDEEYSAEPDDSMMDESPTYETSFDCGRARSIPEQLICQDPMLAANDRELAQLYRLAKASVADQTGLTERARKQWNYREKNCRDKSCLSAWYVYQMDVMRKIALTGDVNAR